MTETTLVVGLPPLAEDGASTADSGFLVKIKIETPNSALAGDLLPVALQQASLLRRPSSIAADGF
jgi:hypothetical protein